MRTKLILLSLFALAAGAEIIDQVAVSAGLQVVTGYSIRNQLRLDAFFANRNPDFAVAARRDAARRLIDQLFIRREVELSRFAPVPVAEVRRYYELLRTERRQDDAAILAALARLNLTEQDLNDYIQWQITLVRFIDFRFRPGIQVSDSEIRAYYEGEFLQELRKTKGPEAPVPPLDEVIDNIVGILTNRKIDAALDQWLETARQQNPVRYREEALR